MFEQLTLEQAIERANQESFSSSISRLNGPLDGVEAKEQGMAAAEAGADRYWVEAAENAVKSVACRQSEFSAADVMDLLDSYGVQTKNGKQLGPVMTRMAKQGICKATSHCPPSHRKSRHAGNQRVWQSLIHSPSFS
jgi:hypothetical protein